LLTHAAKPGLDFTDGTIWCTDGGSPTFRLWRVAVMMGRMMHAYDYIKDTVTTGDRDTILQWFHDCATFLDAAQHNRAGASFPNRLNDDYVTCVSHCPGADIGTLFFEASHPYEDGKDQIKGTQVTKRIIIYLAQ